MKKFMLIVCFVLLSIPMVFASGEKKVVQLKKNMLLN